MKRGPKSSDDWVLLLGGLSIYLQVYLPSR